ncbi:MAG: hypothetical protein KJO56_11990 [Gammaproteobacteria bacterium]|nr:hypothetical protein [Gammaproteobacteria bacterium]
MGHYDETIQSTKGQRGPCPMEIKITPKWIAIVLMSLIGCLTAIHLTLQSIRFVTGETNGLVWFFGLGADGNIPTFYSAFAIILCSALLVLIGVGDLRERKVPAAYWFGLAVIFSFLAVDEMLMLHERLIEPVRDALDTSGAFYYAWVIPYGVAVLVFVAVYLRFLMLLPRKTAALFVAAGALFVAGAIGFEMLGGMQSQTYGNENVIYVALQTIEEVLEMVGIALFAFALADYADERFGGLRLVVSS